MAKLKPIDFKFSAKAGEPLIFRSEVSVADATGVFSLTIPDSLEEQARRIAQDNPRHVAGKNPFPVTIDRPRTFLRVSGATLDVCKAFIAHLAEDFLRCEVTEEVVIAYSLNNQVAYVKDDEGRFFENGNACSEQYAAQTARWCGNLHATKCASHFQVGVVARGFKKITFTRASGTTVIYDRAGPEAGTWLARLNGFAGLAISSRDVRELNQMSQMPYTEDAAKFFFHTMLTMCQLADRIDNFFGDKQALQSAIDRNAGLLAGPTGDLPGLSLPGKPHVD